jgi:hypothetical protein
MHSKHLATFARFSTLLLLALPPACKSGSADGSGTGGANGGSGGSTASGGSTGSGGTSTGAGGTSAGSGGSRTGGGGSRTGGSGTGGTSTGAGGAAPGTGGTTGRGGSNAGTGGAAPRTGGTTGRGGSNAGTGGAAPGTGGTAGGTSTFTVNVELSTAIPTVGIATWSLDAPIDSATIDFGRDQSSFELHAPVDLKATDYRTLLLGMKQDTTYYVRVTASGGGQTYVSKVASIQTGFLPNGLPVQTITDKKASDLYAGGGFTVTCTGYSSGGGFGGPGGSTKGWAFVFDRDGANVWAYDLSQTVVSACTRARMSLDGKFMWIGNFGNTTADGAFLRVSMDGLGTPDAYSLPGRSHDFAILPDEHIVYFARDDGGSGMAPESIFELDPTTSKTTLLYSELTDFGDIFDTRGGHTNQVDYIPELKAISFSMYFINTIALISYPDGKLLASFGGDKSTFSTMSWNGQHGHDVYPDHIAIFNNNGKNGGASVLRFKYDLQAKTATQESDYSSGLGSPAFGDVTELPDGNYFVTYSTSGAMQEIDSSLNLLREVDTNVSIGYTEHRASLYGPPPPYDR